MTTSASNNSQPMRISIEQALGIARKHEEENETGKACALYALILRSFPENAEARNRLLTLRQAYGVPADPPAETVSQLFALSNAREFSHLAERAGALLQEFPASFVLWTLLGAANFELKSFVEAEKYARKALSFRPTLGAAHFNLANALRMQDRTDEALAFYDKALEHDPKLAVAQHHRGLLLYKKGDIGNALRAWDAALGFEADLADAHYGRGAALCQMEKYDEAISSFQQAIELNPAFAEAFDALGNAHFARQELPEAIAALDRALSLNPDTLNAFSLKLWMHAQICDFPAIEGVALRDDLLPFGALALEDNPERQQRRAAINWKALCRHIKPLPLPARVASRPSRLRIGYFSADFHDHATVHLLLGVFREHDRSRFEINAYSYGAHKTGQYRDLLIQCELNFHDVEPLADHRLAELARRHELDIAIDVKGYTADSRSHVFAYRLAPIQINYLAYPGTMGSAAFDYILADRTVIPDDFRRFHTEKILYLPHTYQPNDNHRGIGRIPASRTDFGLPEKGIVFCCFNAPYKISAREFGIWMRILAKVEGSVLWLLRSNPWMEHNLRKEAVARGISPERLVFSDKDAQAVHLARHKHADLFLDTFNYNAHTTVSDALWAGLPVVTKAGRQFAARVAASLLSAVGLPELITETEAEYEAKILELATRPQRLQEIRERLWRNRSTQPLFDTKRYTRNFEAGLQRAYDLYFEGKDPADITISDQGEGGRYASIATG